MVEVEDERVDGTSRAESPILIRLESLIAPEAECCPARWSRLDLEPGTGGRSLSIEV